MWPDFAEVKNYSFEYPRLPLAAKVSWPDSLDPFHLLKQLASSLEGAALLESGRAGRYSYLGWQPILSLRSKGGTATIRYADGTEETVTHSQPLTVLRELMKSYRAPKLAGLPDFSGGAVGYLSYEMNRFFEPTLPQTADDDLRLPDLYVMMYEDLLIFDHEQRELICLTHLAADSLTEESYQVAADRLMTHLHQLTQLVTHEPTADWEELRKHPLQSDKPAAVSFDQEKFEAAVRRVQEYIAQGDVFQVNLSVRQSKPVDASADQIYEVLRRLNPSPYMGYLHFPEFQLVSGSPELLIKVRDGWVSTRPIAGTRPRGRDEREDEALARELIDNEKERAEHVMLVDLERNDLGRVCRYGSVEVSEFMVVEKYSHVMHIVSHVRGQLAAGKDAYEAIAAAFPGGTITGAPKVRTMEIIDELEPVTRGVYTGSIGWFGFDGDVELNIAIRTMIVKDGLAHVQAGAGIVIDSSPEAEYRESLKKAEALWKALELSELRMKS
ncbi:anthranilate synthase component I family protein [Brevibacillus humidisoli]|uniref:anthranilate synthase component I family protein n=1 Tax=Brevibacillus humidisoli TaxID=2895522 RepID=UPI001E318399|nr:anthranilate synthase component I family protein [Brevibacillus humidisoli]UFJ43408.1 anthranilate synthase component I family protein [Brevibacillus humidisoli]